MTTWVTLSPQTSKAEPGLNKIKEKLQANHEAHQKRAQGNDHIWKHVHFPGQDWSNWTKGLPASNRVELSPKRPCGYKIQTVKHTLLEYPVFAALREKMWSKGRETDLCVGIHGRPVSETLTGVARALLYLVRTTPSFLLHGSFKTL